MKMVWLPLSRIRSHGFRNTSEEMASGKAERFQWENLLGDNSVHALFCVLFVLSICANFRVIYVVLARLSRARRQVAVNLLVLHLSFIVMGILGLTLSKIVDILVKFQGPILCRVMGFFKGALVGAFSTNMMAIVYERVILPLQSYRNHLVASRLIILVWILPILQGMLDVFASSSIEEEELVRENYSSSFGNCVLVPMFQSEMATIISECFRFVTFHLVVTLYMAFAIFKLGLSLNSLYEISPTRDDSFQRKLQSIRYILIHLGTFVVFWIPIGFFTFCRRLVSSGIPLLEDPQTDWLYQNIKDETTFLNKVIGLSTLVYLTLNPIINLLLLDDNKLKICPCKADGFTVSTTSTPPPVLYESESGDVYRMGYLREKGAGGSGVAYATGELPSCERERSKASSDYSETCKVKVVQTEVMVHEVEKAEVKAEASGDSNSVKELE